MSKATEFIEREHREAVQVFARFEQQQDRSTAMELCDLLERHTQMEEAILYPELRRVDESLYEDAKEEHEQADQVIKQIRSADDIDRIAELVSELQEMVQHHVSDEENEDLPKMEQSCGAERMNELGSEMQRWKQQHAAGGDGEGALLDLTKDELYEKAQEADVEGRSEMTKEELAEALSKG